MPKSITMSASLCAALAVIGTAPRAWAAQGNLEVRVSQTRVKLFEKVEFSLGADRPCSNPYDDSEVNVQAEFTTPGGRKVCLPAFYCQSFERKIPQAGAGKTEWVYPSGPAMWKVRFSPMEVGPYSCVVSLRDARGTAQSKPVAFECIPSQRKGCVRVSAKDPRYLELTDGTCFFPIGHDIAFIGPPQYVRDLAKVEEIFRKKSANGGNFARMWACCEDWGMAIEARKSAWGRSWAWNPPIVPMPGQENDPAARRCVRLSGKEGATLSVSPTRTLCVKPQTPYRLTGRARADDALSVSVQTDAMPQEKTIPAGSQGDWAAFREEFTTSAAQWWLNRIVFRLKGQGSASLSDLSLREAAGGPELLWQADVNRPVMGWYDQEDCDLLDRVLQAGEENGVYLQVVLLTRDLYMPLLKDEKAPEYDRAIQQAKRLLRYAVARWGCSTSLAVWEYFNEMDPARPTGRFYRELGEYLEKVDVYGHLRATSDWAPCVRDWAHPKLDTADMHFYLRPVIGEEWKDAAATTAKQAAFLRGNSPLKPALLSEFGLADDKWGLSPYMQKDADLLHFHDALWASAMSGMSGSAMFWWWEQLDRMDAYRHYKPLSTFLADVPFTKAGFKPSAWETPDRKLRVTALLAKDSACLWMSDPQATWWKAAVDKAAPPTINGASLRIQGLQTRKYRVQWWNTYEGRLVKEQDASPAGQGLLLSVPSFTRDIACKVAPAP